MIALGSGITLAAVLHILRHTGIPSFALCPETDFVRCSRLYRPLPTPFPNPAPEDLPILLSSLEIEAAVLLPCSDDWLRAVATLPGPLAKRFPSSTSCVDLLTDKWRFARLLKSLNIPHPRTELVSSREQFHTFSDLLFEGAILKPLSSVDFAMKHGVKGYLVDSRKQALELLRTIDLPIMLQEFVPGPPTAGYFLDGFRDREGCIRAMLARRRLRMHPARLGNSTLIESIPISELQEARSSLEHLLEEISYRGVFSAEFKFDGRDRKFKLIEINARPWWYVEFSERCGVNICAMAYRDALGLPVGPVLDYEIGRRCSFAFNELMAWTKRGPSEVSLMSLLGTWLSSDSTLFHWDDPLPALRYMTQRVHAFWSTLEVRFPQRTEPVPLHQEDRLPASSLSKQTTAGD